MRLPEKVLFPPVTSGLSGQENKKTEEHYRISGKLSTQYQANQNSIRSPTTLL
ncbi:EHEC factor for adherence domain protein [Escherichia coli DEC2C]|nr:EHEC factor for adherence domain protein [Escherichia coli DEC2C]